MEEAVSDLADLKWKEFSVTSLETLNLKTLFSRNRDARLGLQNNTAPIPKRKRSRRKMLSLTSLNGLNNHSSPALNGFGFGSASGNVRKKLPCRRKMIVRSDDETDGGDFGSTTAKMTNNLGPRRCKIIVRSDDETGTAVY